MTTEPSGVPISKRLVLVNSASGMATRVLTVGVFAWVIQYLMKRIPEAELELLPIVLSVALVLPLLQTILTGGLSRHVTEAYARNDLAGVTRIVSSQFPLLVVGSVLVMIFGGIVAWNIGHILDIAPTMIGQARFMTFLVVARMSIIVLLAPFNTGLFARQRFVLKNVIDIAGSLVRIVLMVWLILGIGPQVQWVILAQVASQLFVQITQTAVSMRLLPALRYRPRLFDWNTCKMVLTFGGWNFVADSANLIRRAADAPILNLCSTPVAVNDFFLGSLFDSQLRQMVIVAAEPLTPALTAMHAHEQHSRLAAVFLRGGRVLLWASMFLAVPLIVFSYDLFALYLGDKYAEHVQAGTVMILLLLGFPFIYLGMMFVRIVYAKGDLRGVAIRSIIIQAGNLLLTLVLVGWYGLGAIGSATATLAAFVVGYPCLFWPLAQRTLELSWRRFFVETLFPGLLPSVVAGFAGLIVAEFVPSLIARVIVGVLVCLTTYAVTVVCVMRPVDRADFGRIRKLARI